MITRPRVKILGVTNQDEGNWVVSAAAKAPDVDALKKAIELPWSNGQAEGQINRLKMLKLAMYGRDGSELMRARMLPLNHRNWG